MSLVLCALALGACRTLPPAVRTPWVQQRAALQSLDQFALRGQLAAASSGGGFSAALSWQQTGATADAWLRAPLGLGGAHLIYDGADLQWTASDGVALDGVAAHGAVVSALGFEPPLASLRYWLLGVPDPSLPKQESLDSQQRLSTLTQAGWRIEYGNYERGSYTVTGEMWLPASIVLQRDAWRLKLHVAHWQLP